MSENTFFHSLKNRMKVIISIQLSPNPLLNSSNLSQNTQTYTKLSKNSSNQTHQNFQRHPNLAPFIIGHPIKHFAQLFKNVIIDNDEKLKIVK